MRVKRGTSHLRRRNRLLKRVKGYRWGRKNRIKLAKVAALKAGVHAYRDRRVKKRNARRLWNIRINAAARAHGMSYSKFIFALKKSKINLDRKSLAELAMNQPKAFEALIKSLGK